MNVYFKFFPNSIYSKTFSSFKEEEDSTLMHMFSPFFPPPIAICHSCVFHYLFSLSKYFDKRIEGSRGNAHLAHIPFITLTERYK